jgi:hypothetical protein
MRQQVHCTRILSGSTTQPSKLWIYPERERCLEVKAGVWRARVCASPMLPSFDLPAGANETL